MGHLVDDAVLVVSELMTNAYDASVTLPHVPPITLRLLANHESLVIEAWDYSPYDLEAADAPDDESEHGRGLLVVEMLAQRWGTKRISQNRKVVWAELTVLPLPVTDAGLPLRHHVRRTLDREPDFISDPELLRRVHRGLRKL